MIKTDKSIIFAISIVKDILENSFVILIKMLSKLIPAAILLGACLGLTCSFNTQASSERVLGINDLKLFIGSQQLHLRARLELTPPAADWSAIYSEIKINKLLMSDGLLIDERYILIYGADLPTHRTCVRFGSYAITKKLNEGGCPGDWLQNRADSGSTGSSSFRLNWDRPPTKHHEISLHIRQGLANSRIDTVILPNYGLTAFIQDGSVVKAYSEAGYLIWQSESVGIGEIIDVVDLDGDETPEVIFSSRSGFSASGPGQLMVLSATTGELLWRYAFEDLEFGINRHRTTIIPLDGSGAKSILATMTYSPSLFRFDFSQGARNGVLTWKSEQFIYDSPDKNPLVGDFDGDGELEVIVDSRGTLYILSAANGRIKSQLKYGEAPTFQGFLASHQPADQSGKFVVSASQGIYYKGYITANNSSLDLSPVVIKQWEVGIEKNSINVDFLDAPLEVFNRLGGAIPVTINDGSSKTIQLIDLITGAILWALPYHEALYPVSGPNGVEAIAAHGPDGAVIISLDRIAPIVIASFPGSVFLGSKSIRHCTSTKRSLCGAGAALRRDSYDQFYLDNISANLEVTSQVIDGFDFANRANEISIIFSGELVLASDGLNIYKINQTGIPSHWFKYAPEIFMTPLVADIDGNGIREIVLPFGRGLSRLRIHDGSLVTKTSVFDLVPSQWAESFHVPVILNRSINTQRRIVGFRTIKNPNGTHKFLVSGAAVGNSSQWDVSFNQNSWERLLLALPGNSGGDNVALRHSRGTTLFDGSSGMSIWSNSEVGECQRQMASVDWNGDGVGDLILQTGPTSWVYDGTNGNVLYTKYVRTAYGAYSAGAGVSGRDLSLVQSGAGALIFMKQSGMFAEIQSDSRKIESLPVVIGRQSYRGQNKVFRANGMGDLTVFDMSGNLLQHVQLRLPVVAITGAYLDSDESIDLLITTSDGKLIGISGIDLREIWRLQLDGALGTPVASTLNGIDPVILVASSRGVLYVLGN